MSAIDGVNNSLIQSQLANIQLRQEIDTKIAKKTLDMAKNQGEMVLKLLSTATDVVRQNTPAQRTTLGAIVSGLGQNIDLQA